jgi:two-component system, NarL family, response regulator DevR
MTQSETKSIRVLLVDDHTLVRLGLRTLLNRFSHLEVVAEADTVAGALAETERLRPGVVLLDVQLPDGNGVDACRRIQQLSPETRVLILTAFADEALIYEAILAGADGYLLKQINSEALVRAIEDVAQGKSILDPSLTSSIFQRIKSSPPANRKDKLELLSAQEKRVLALVAQGMTNKEIAAAMKLSDKTVKNYLSNLLDKLQLSRRTQAAAYFAKFGPV